METKFKEIYERGLKPSVYEYLDIQRRNYPIKAVGIITEKQLVFFSAIKKGDMDNHDEIAWGLSNIMYPQCNGNIGEFIEKDKDNILLAGVNKYFSIFLPDNKNLSQRKVDMLSYVLYQIEKYNNEVEKSQNIKLSLIGLPFAHLDLTIPEIIKKLNYYVVNIEKPLDDIIIGTTYDEVMELSNEFISKRI